METKVDKMLATATRIAELQRELGEHKAKFRQMAGSGLPGVGDAPISQQVLQAVAKGPKTRGEIIRAVGGHDSAVTSALKKHKAAGRLAHADGKYVAPGTPTPIQRKPRTPK
jgi:hypothetical protein